MISVLLALCSATAYGVGDFLGGLAARKWRVLPVTLVSFATGAVLLTLALPFVATSWSGQVFGLGMLAAATAVIGFLTFYAALAVGPIAIITPLVALLNSLVPLVWSAFFGTPLGLVTWIAIGFAVVASVLIGMERGADMHGLRPRTVALTAVSGISFGISALAVGVSPQNSGIGVVFLEMTVGTLLLGVFALLALIPSVRRQAGLLDAGHSPSKGQASPARTRGALALASASGVLTGLANWILTLAFHAGELAIVAVLNNLYPLATMLLAWAVLRERVSILQAIGAGLAVVASAMLGAAGGGLPAAGGG